MSIRDIYEDWRKRIDVGAPCALHQSTHEAINGIYYPGTRQLCALCDEPTGRCEEDALYIEDTGPLCQDCYEERTYSA